ncbi:hypothetical protein ABZ905_36750 [Streptomyces parvus]|uniref:hypothetical protein n=1 Tax=Streptomyces parvus TaxID=66428 RepID=UPI0033DE575F
MAQHDAQHIENYTTTEGDRVYRYEVNGVHSVAFIYADQSPQFIACDSEQEAERVFVRAMLAADKSGTLDEKNVVTG